MDHSQLDKIETIIGFLREQLPPREGEPDPNDRKLVGPTDAKALFADTLEDYHEAVFDRFIAADAKG